MKVGCRNKKAPAFACLPSAPFPTLHLQTTFPRVLCEMVGAIGSPGRRWKNKVRVFLPLLSLLLFLFLPAFLSSLLCS